MISLVEMKERVRERDNHTCRQCGKYQETPLLHVHHLDKNRDNNIESNLITVCSHCHGILHTGEVRIRPKKINETTYEIITDHLGRVTIPKELLNALGIDFNDASNAPLLFGAYPTLDECNCIFIKKAIK